MKRAIRILFGIFSIITLLLICTNVMSYDNVVDFVSQNQDGIMYGFAGASAAEVVEGATSTTETAKAKSPDLLTDTVSDKITRIKPSATPMDTIMRKIGMVTNVDSWKTKFYEVDVRGVDDKLTVAFDTSAAGTYDSSTGLHVLTVENIHIWSVDDTLMIKGTTGSDGGEIVCSVIAKDNLNKKLSVFPLNGTGGEAKDLPDMAIDTELVRLSNSKHELDAQTDPYSIYPQTEYNYMQIHMAQIEEGTYEQLHDKEVKWDMNDHKMQALYDLRRQMEFTSLFGVRKEFVNPVDGKKRYFSGGITRFIEKTMGYTKGSLSSTDFIGWTEEIFVGNAGSDTRILFAGSELLTDMHQIDTISKQLGAKEVKVKWGVQFTEIETIYGILLLKHHQLLDNAGWSDRAIVLDVANIEKHVFKQMTAKRLDLKTSGIKNADAIKIEETFCTVTRNKDTHGIIKPN